MSRFALGAALLLSTVCVAHGDELRNVPVEVSSGSHNSGWKSEKPGLVVAKDTESYMRALRLIYGDSLDRIRVRSFDDRYVYLYLFAGQTTAGGGNGIEVLSAKREGNGLTVKVRVISPAPRGDFGITLMSSPWVLAKVKQSDLGRIRDAHFKLSAELLQRVDVIDIEPTSPGE